MHRLDMIKKHGRYQYCWGDHRGDPAILIDLLPVRWTKTRQCFAYNEL
jgi:hypothetical protein